MESSAAYQAVAKGDVEALKAALAEAGADPLGPAARDHLGRSLLHHAVILKADPEVLKVLVCHVDISLMDCEGKTVRDFADALDNPEPAHQVINERLREIVMAGQPLQPVAHHMLTNGWSYWPITEAEAEQHSEGAKDLWGKIFGFIGLIGAAHVAGKEGRLTDLGEQLTSAPVGDLCESADVTGLSMLHKAVLLGDSDLASTLATDFARTLKKVDPMGRTALHYAAGLSDDGTFYKLLLAVGSDENAKDLLDKTPVDYKGSPEELKDAIKGLQIRIGVVFPSPSEEELPEKVVPVEMYVPTAPPQRSPPPTSVDGKYVAQHLGTALTLALAEIAEKRPRDPIEYLGEWLYKYKQTLNENDQAKQLLARIREEEAAADREAEMKLRRKKEMKKFQEEERKRKEAEEAERQRLEQEEADRRAKEAILSKPPELPTVTEGEEDDTEDAAFRKRNDKGQTEFHILASQNGADVQALINLGYSLADRDANNKTPRDVAEENGLTENVAVIDNYISNLIEQENVDKLRGLIYEGYDKLGAVLDQVSTDGLSSKLIDFVNNIPAETQKVSALFDAVTKGELAEVQATLDKDLVVAKDVHGRSVLHVAVLTANVDICRYIATTFRHAARTRDNLNRTPLHYAEGISEELAELLKANGADPNAKDAKQRLASYFTEEKDEIQALKNTLGNKHVTIQETKSAESIPPEDQKTEEQDDEN